MATKGLEFGWVAVPLAAGVALSLRLSRGRWWLPTGLDLPLGLIVVGSLVGLWPSIDPRMSRERLCGVVLGVVLCYGLAWLLEGEAGLARYSLGIVLLGAAVAVLGTAQVDMNAWKLNALNRPVYQVLAHLPRLTRDAIHQNGLAAFLVALLPLGLCLAFAPLGRASRVLSACATTVMAAALLLTASRAGLLAAAVCLLAVCVFARRSWLWLGSGAAGSAGLVLLASGALGVTLDLSLQPTGTSSAERLALWSAGLAMAAHMPFTGIGLGTFPLVLALHLPPSMASLYPQVHNLFLQSLLDGGILALTGTCGLVLLWALGARSLPCLGGVRRWVALGSWAGFGGLLLHGQVDSPWTGDSRIYFFLLLPLGLLLAAVRGGVWKCGGADVWRYGRRDGTCQGEAGDLHTSRPPYLHTGQWWRRAAFCVAAALAPALWPVVRLAVADNLAWAQAHKVLLGSDLSEVQRDWLRRQALGELSARPGSPGAARLLARLYLHAGDEAAARQALASAVKYAADGGVALDLGWLELRRGRADLATAAWRPVASDEQLRGRARVLAAEGRLDQALTPIDLLRTVFPGDPRLAEDHAEVRWRRDGAPPEAAPRAARMAWSAGNPEGDFWRGVELRWQGDLPGAIRALARANQRIPNNPLFRLELAETYRQAGQLAEAERQYRALLSFDPGNLPSAARIESLQPGRAACRMCWAGVIAGWSSGSTVTEGPSPSPSPGGRGDLPRWGQGS